MFGAVPAGSARNDFSPFGYKAFQDAYVFIIRFERFIGAKPAHLAPKARAASRSEPLAATPFGR
jgi:hypothetical protein